VVGPDGRITQWAFEADAPAILARAGLTGSSLAVGETVTVVANPLKDGRQGGSLVRVVKADGQVLNARP
jgi:hypothetical protein